MGSLFSRIWKTSKNEHDIENGTLINDENVHVTEEYGNTDGNTCSCDETYEGETLEEEQTTERENYKEDETTEKQEAHGKKEHETEVATEEQEVHYEEKKIEENHCEQHESFEEMISYPDNITAFDFQYHFKAKTNKEPEGIHWNLFMQYDTSHTQTITFLDFLKIVQ